MTHSPDSELLDARIASSLNKIVQNSYLKKKVSLENIRLNKAERFLRGKQIAIVTASGSLASTTLCSIMPTFSLLFFGMTIFRNSIQDVTKFHFLWNKFPPSDILESLYILRRRETDKLKTILELYNLEIHQKKAKPDCHKLKTMDKKKCGAGSDDEEFLRPEKEELNQTCWSRIEGGNVMFLKDKVIVGS